MFALPLPIFKKFIIKMCITVNGPRSNINMLIGSLNATQFRGNSNVSPIFYHLTMMIPELPENCGFD